MNGDHSSFIYKNKSQQISPKSKNKLYNYQPLNSDKGKRKTNKGCDVVVHCVQNNPRHHKLSITSVSKDTKPTKITMNVSIDLSQNQSHKVKMVENNYFKNIASKNRKEQGNTKNRIATFSNEERCNSNKGQKCIEEQIQEEDTEKEHSTKRKSSRKTPDKKPSESARIQGVMRSKRKSSQDSANVINNKGDFGTKFPPVEEETKNLSNNSFYKNEDLKEQQNHPGIFDSVEFDDLPLEFSNMNEESQDIDEGLLNPASQNVGQRLDTIETDLSALNLSPRSKASKKLKKLIKMTFKKFNKAPDTTSEFYRVGKVLGRGAFGKVNLTIHRLTEEMVAIKSLNKEFLTDEVSRQKVMKEVKILKKMRHKNIIQLLDTFETQKHIIFVMELCSGGDLLNYVRKRRKLTEDNAKPLFKQILEALQYCHRLNILHRDIKLDNIILDSEGVIKVGDFGVSKIIDPKEVMYDQ